MLKKYISINLSLITGFLLLIVSSCKKDNTTTNNTTKTTNTATPVKLGMYEESDIVGVDSPTYRALFMTVSKVGTQTLSEDYNGLIFDTGSGGLVMDAHDILPASLITASGFNFTGDSTVVDGITITNQTSTIVYGDDAASDATVYGNLAYADVIIGEPTDATITVKRLPFFLYYKSTDANGNAIAAHEFDVLGVNSEYDLIFNNGATIGSPFATYNPGTGLTQGFKMPALGTSNFSDSNSIPLTSGVVTVGLTAADLASSSGYKMFTLTNDAPYGYPPVIPSTVAYNGKTDSAYVVFDSGTDPFNYIEDKTAGNATTQLPANTPVSVTTTSYSFAVTSASFNYPFTTSATDYLTYIENPNESKTDISILSLEYFLNNSYLMDFPDHKLGLKNN